MLRFRQFLKPLPPLYTARLVSSATRLANHFNHKASVQWDFFTKNSAGLLNFPELHSHTGFSLLQENVTQRCGELVNEICAPQRQRNIVQIFDDLSNTLCKVADMAEFIRTAHNSNNFRNSAEDACINICEIVERLNTNKEIYDKLKDVSLNGDKFPMDDLDRHVIELFLCDFEQCGIHLDQRTRAKVVQLNDSILRIGQKFSAAALAPRIVPGVSLPEYVRKYFTLSGDSYVVPSFYSDSPNAFVRELSYRLYLHPDSNQRERLTDLLNNRHRLAELCGFETYAHRAVKNSIVENPTVILDFLNKLSKQLRPYADDDYQILIKMKQAEFATNVNTVDTWDVPYYSGKFKRECSKVSFADFAPYFSLGNCMEGLNNLMKSLFGVDFEYEQLELGESWAPNIHKLAVKHETEGLLGHIYCDFFHRKDKPNQDSHFTIRGGQQLPDGTYQTPIVVVSLSFKEPTWAGPLLLSPSMIGNLFHEMGHAMHAMLARTRYQHISGTRCSTDFAEVPSILMEHFSQDTRVVKTFARHYKTGEPIPDVLLKAFCLSRHLFNAADTQTQVFYAALDQIYHGKPNLSETMTTTEILRQTQNEYHDLPYVDNTAYELRFSHLVGYGAKYYAYLISRAIAASIWHKYFEKDPFSRSEGEHYRRDCLIHGGGVPTKILAGNFLQHEITADYLTQGLINDIERSNAKIKRYAV